MNPTLPRRIERTLSIGAPVDAVWKALTDATELMRWFPLRATVSPGAGGLIHMEWDETYNADSTIEAWEPGRHLRIGFPHHPPVLLATDYYLKATRAARFSASSLRGSARVPTGTIGMRAWAPAGISSCWVSSIISSITGDTTERLPRYAAGSAWRAMRRGIVSPVPAGGSIRRRSPAKCCCTRREPSSS